MTLSDAARERRGPRGAEDEEAERMLLETPDGDGELLPSHDAPPKPLCAEWRRWSKTAALTALSLALLLFAKWDSQQRQLLSLFGVLREFGARPHAQRHLAPPAASGFRDSGRGSGGLRPWSEAVAKAERVVDGLSQRQTRDLVHGKLTQGPGFYVGNLAPVDGSAIPALKMEDASSGFRLKNPMLRGTTTQWPCLLALASTWDEALVGDVATGIAREFLGKGANVLLGPSVNVHRTAYGGRNFEYLSGEDPYLGARLTRAYVTSLQAEGVMAVVKHFAFNEQETWRGHESSEVDARTAWELYYPPFEAAIQAGATAVMCSYNQVNGTSSCENRALLMGDLREQMGFKGFVMSDWRATHSTGALQQGLDVEMPYAKWFTDERLLDAVPAGAVREAAVRVLSAIFRMRLDEKPGCSPPCFHEILSDQRTEAHVRLARDAATQSVTLLKNNGVLPLDPSAVRRLALLGRAATAEDVPKEWHASPYAGGGSGHVLSPDVVTPLAAIRERAAAAGIEVLHNLSRNALGNPSADERSAADAAEEARELALEADVVIVVACALSREGVDRETLALAWEADSLISAVAKLRPTVVLMQTPGAVLTPWRDEVAAVANLFYGGEQTGNAWAAVIFGDHAPTGRLPIAFPASEEDAIEPGKSSHPGHYYSVRYAEGLETSYRSSTLRAAYPFGHGLSYTRFSFGAPEVIHGQRCPEAVCVRLSISNVGERPGLEVAQAYLEFPGAAAEPHFVLRGFQRTRVLRPGERQELLIAFTARDLSIYSVRSGWERPRDVTVHVGASSADIRHTVVLLPASGAAFRPIGFVWRAALALALGQFLCQ